MNHNEPERAAYAAVDEALRTMPLAQTPPTLLPNVMTHIRRLQPVQRFRLEWLDVALSLFAAGMMGVMLLLWQVMAPQFAANPELQGELAFWLANTDVQVLGLLVAGGLGLALMALLFAMIIFTWPRAFATRAGGTSITHSR